MAVSVQRLLIFTSALWVIFLLTNIWYNTSDTNYSDEIKAMSASNQNLSKMFNDQYGEANPDVESTYLEQQYGDVKLSGNTYFKILSTQVGLTEAPNSADWIEKEMITWVNWVIRIINILLGLEIVYMWYSKKSS